jgi:hypothetical protein
VTQEILKQHLHGIGEFGDASEAVLLCRFKRIVMVGLGANLEGLAAFEAVQRGHRCAVPKKRDKMIEMAYR